jgi:hypothetical protein
MGVALLEAASGSSRFRPGSGPFRLGDDPSRSGLPLPSSSLGLAIVLLTTATTATDAAPAAASVGRFVGTCYVNLDVAYSPAATVLPAGYAEITLTDPGGNFCVVAPDLVVDVTLQTPPSGPMATPPIIGHWGCATGVAQGEVYFSVNAIDFPDPMIANATVVNVGGTIHMVLTVLPLTFEGVGTFVQDPFDTAACAVGGTPIAATTWTGLLTFQA